jgi:hypothetical protein
VTDVALVNSAWDEELDRLTDQLFGRPAEGCLDARIGVCDQPTDPNRHDRIRRCLDDREMVGATWLPTRRHRPDARIQRHREISSSR